METSTLSIGLGAEDLASALLEDRGYFVVERNFRCKAGELDVIAYRADPRLTHREARMLVFVEIRSRGDDEHGDALDAINVRKQRQVVRMAGHYLAARQPAYDEIRFDIVGITNGVPVLIEDAFRA